MRNRSLATMKINLKSNEVNFYPFAMTTKTAKNAKSIYLQGF
jgi:hypothetical protein